MRYHRLLEAFSKSDDERDFFFNKIEGFLIFINLDKDMDDVDAAYQEIAKNPEIFVEIPKLTFYEMKKLMEGFVNEKVYDIDTKEKLLDIIGSREARDNFLEFIYDHLMELDKWQQYYHEKSRIRIIEWLRENNIKFVFEEDVVELSRPIVERLKEHLFDEKVSKELIAARAVLEAKAKTYYSSEALNPKPKRGRPPKQQQKVELDPQLTDDLYTSVPALLRQFVFAPEYSTSTVTFSEKFETAEQLLASLKGSKVKVDTKLEILSQRLESLRSLSSKLKGVDGGLLPAGESPEKAAHQFTSTKEEPKTSKLSSFFKEVLPKKKSEKLSLQEMVKNRKAAKEVSPISKKKKKT